MTKEIKWFPWNDWPFITNNVIAITSVHFQHDNTLFDGTEYKNILRRKKLNEKKNYEETEK